MDDGWEFASPPASASKEEYGKECKICTRPFTIVMQDIKRPRFVRLAASSKTFVKFVSWILSMGCQFRFEIPRSASIQLMQFQSDVNRDYFAEEYDRKARAGIDYEFSYGGKVRPSDTILKLQRTTRYYKRNQAHVCSFFVCGECTGGLECPYRHEMPVTGELSQQNIKDRYYGQSK